MFILIPLNIQYLWFFLVKLVKKKKKETIIIKRKYVDLNSIAIPKIVSISQ